MAASRTMSRTDARIRIAEIYISKDKTIQPFWLFVKFENCRLICNVEEKILSILNSLMLKNESNGSDSKKERALARSSTQSPSALASEPQSAVVKSPSCLRKSPSSRRSNNNNAIEYHSMHSESSDHASGMDYTITKEAACLNFEEKLDQLTIVSCQLWMDGFLLLSKESSEIFQDGDLVTVKCTLRKKYLISESGTNIEETDSKRKPHKEKKKKKRESINLEHFDKKFELTNIQDADSGRKSHKKDKRKKRNDEIIPINDQFGEHFDANRELTETNKEQVITNCKISNPIEDNYFSTPSQQDSSARRKSDSRKSKRNGLILNKKNKEYVPEKDIICSGDENELSRKKSKGDGLFLNDKKEELIPEQEIISRRDGIKLIKDSCHQNKANQISSDILLLMNQKIEELTGNQKVPSEGSTNQTFESDIPHTNTTMEEDGLKIGEKRKRRRKRKKKSRIIVTEKTIVNSGTKIMRSSSLNLAVGNRPENIRTTFETDSDSDTDEESVNTDRDQNISEPMESSCIYMNSSTPICSVPNEKQSELQINNIQNKLLVLSGNDAKNKDLISESSIHFKSPTLQFAQGQSLDPSSRFDELLQRRRFTSNNHQAGSLCNGAHVFKREKQKNNPVRSIGSNSQPLTMTRESKEAALDTSEDSYNLRAESSVSLQSSQSSSKLNLVEVTPLYLDVERCEPLKGVPCSGDIIAYKVLELSDDYTPSMSDFKQGQVTSCDRSMVHIELFDNSVPKKREGRFELIYDEDKEGETTETCEKKNYVSIDLGSMVDARLVQRSQPKD